MDNRHRRVVVVGGGITGLTAAYRLAQAAERDAKLSIDLIEGADRLGGKIVTEHIDGFLLEGGPDTFLARKPEAIALCNEVGLGSQLISTQPNLRRSFVSRGGRLYRLPDGMSGLVPSKLGPLFTSGVLSPAGKLRAALEPFVRRQIENGDVSVADFVRRRLGTEAYDRLIEPLLCGIYAGDGEQLSLAATVPILRHMEQEHGSIIRGLRLAGRSAANEPMKYPTPFVALSGGTQGLVDALRHKLGAVRIRTSTQVITTHRDAGTFDVVSNDGEHISANALILATPSYASADLLRAVNPDAAGVLESIRFVSNAAVFLGFHSKDLGRLLDGYGYVVPREEGGLTLACTWASSKLPNRSPSEKVLVRVFLGRDGREVDAAIDDETLVQTARDEVRSVLGVSADPVLTRLFRYPKAMPQYTLGHSDRLAALERHLEETPGVFVAGNSYRGVGIPDCIRSGHQAASNTLRYLESAGD